MSDSKDETIRIRINSDMKKALEELSKQENTAMSELIREGITLELYIWAEKTNYSLPENVDRYVIEEIVGDYKAMKERMNEMENEVKEYRKQVKAINERLNRVKRETRQLYEAI